MILTFYWIPNSILPLFHWALHLLIQLEDVGKSILSTTSSPLENNALVPAEAPSKSGSDKIQQVPLPLQLLNKINSFVPVSGGFVEQFEIGEF